MATEWEATRVGKYGFGLENASMNSGVVHSALDSALENSLLKAVASEKSRRMLDLGRLLLETVSEDDDRCDKVDTFSHKL